MNHPLIQLLLMALAAFGLLRWLAGSDLGFLLVVLITAMAAFGAVLVYLMRFDSAKAERLYRIGFLKPVINLICKMGGLQPPVAGTAGSSGALSSADGRSTNAAAKDRGASAAAGRSSAKKAPPPEIQLQKSEDFTVAKGSICSVVRGHDTACNVIFDYLERNVVVRARQEAGTSLPPLGAFLLVGSPGIGKRYIATALSQLLYAGKGLCRIDLRDYPSEDGIQQALASSKQDSGAVISAVRSRPYQVIVFENIEAADRKGIEMLTGILGGGACRDESTGANISFQNCVFFLTTGKSVPLLQAIRDKRLPRQKFLSEARDALGAETQVNEPLLARLGEVLVLDDPDLIVKAEVVALLMQRECRRFDVRLDYVEPYILADEVARLTNAHGFEPVPGRVAALMREPLYRVSKTNAKRLILDANSVEVEQPAAPPRQDSMSQRVSASPTAQ